MSDSESVTMYVKFSEYKSVWSAWVADSPWQNDAGPWFRLRIPVPKDLLLPVVNAEVTK